MHLLAFALFSSACGSTSYLFPQPYVEMARAAPAPLPKPIARLAVLLYQLDDRVAAPPPTTEGLDRAIRRTYGNAETTRTIVDSRPSLAGGIAIAAGAAILDGNYESVVRLAASQMRAIAPEAPNAQLYLFLRMQSNKAYKPHVVMATVDAYLVRDGTILHSTRAMTEQVYIGGGGPSAAPAGFEQPQGEALRSLLVSDGVDHPYNFLVVLARWAIDDLHRQGVAGQSSNAPRA